MKNFAVFVVERNGKYTSLAFSPTFTIRESLGAPTPPIATESMIMRDSSPLE